MSKIIMSGVGNVVEKRHISLSFVGFWIGELADAAVSLVQTGDRKASHVAISIHYPLLSPRQENEWTVRCDKLSCLPSEPGYIVWGHMQKKIPHTNLGQKEKSMLSSGKFHEDSENFGLNGT